MENRNILGRTAVFDPLLDDNGQGHKELSCKVRGKVVYVNWNHRWFSVQYGKMRISFQFSDIGKKVKIL